MKNILRLDPGSVLVMILTFILFVAALFFKGLTHDLLLEAGVFLVSVKLIIMAYKVKVSNDSIMMQLQEIKLMLDEARKNRCENDSAQDKGGR